MTVIISGMTDVIISRINMPLIMISYLYDQHHFFDRAALIGL